MKVICAWCNTLIEENKKIPIKQISHGMCKKCSNEFKKDVDKLKK